MGLIAAPIDPIQQSVSTSSIITLDIPPGGDCMEFMITTLASMGEQWTTVHFTGITEEELVHLNKYKYQCSTAAARVDTDEVLPNA